MPMWFLMGTEVDRLQRTPTHDKRSKGQISARVCFNANTPCKTKKEVFLSNPINKQDLINIIGQNLTAYGFSVYHAEGDDGLLIVKTAITNSVVQVQSLPPTQSAAKYHSFRAYTQIQVWIGKEGVPLEWGWYRKDNKFVPVKCDYPTAPERLLKIIRCSCKGNCDTRRCTCRRHGLMCSMGCGECQGVSCSNSGTIADDEEVGNA
ncbi:hypothetical protein MAR_021125 [Mya arenaria]|uniref:Tesmin/TSO1-like CXC domain-containing protein n=1 Tax=Mya arenaria TaxID=6604 RepID=A0ABY7EF14_MYAAR|nr:hypothetical protein MAR_021125 [Mya arenaria]